MSSLPACITGTLAVDAASVVQAFLAALVFNCATRSVPSIVAGAAFRLGCVVHSSVFLGITVTMRQAFIWAKFLLAMETSPQTIALALEVDTLAVVAAVVVAGDFGTGKTSKRSVTLTDSLAVFNHTLAVFAAIGVTDRGLAVVTSPPYFAETAHLLFEVKGGAFGHGVAFAVPTALVPVNFGADFSVAVHASVTGFTETFGVHALSVARAVVVATNRRTVEPNEPASAVANMSTGYVVLNTDPTTVDTARGTQRSAAITTSPTFFAETAGELAVVVALGVFRTVASSVAGTTIGANSGLTVVTFPPWFTVALLVQADTMLGAVFVADNIQALQTTEALRTLTYWQTIGVTTALTSSVAVRWVAQTLSAIGTSPPRVTAALAFNTSTVVTAFTSSRFAAPGTSPALVANTPFFLDTFELQRVVVPNAHSVRVAVVGAFLSLALITHVVAVAVASFVVASPVARAVVGTGDILTLIARKAHRASTFAISFAAINFNTSTLPWDTFFLAHRNRAISSCVSFHANAALREPGVVRKGKLGVVAPSSAATVVRANFLFAVDALVVWMAPALVINALTVV